MRIIHYPSLDEKQNTQNLAVALGYFDGVHRGHRALISRLIEVARDRQLTPCIFTFSNSPSKTKNTQTTLYNIEEKIEIFTSLGIEAVILADFDSVSNLDAKSFVKDVLIDSLGARFAICGYNFRFGRGAHASAEDMVRLMESHSCGAEILDEQKVDGISVSATEIRNLLLAGNTEEAAKLLGAPYFISGTVERGLGLGAAYGFPTVNMPIREDSPLLPGVYRTAVRVGDTLYTGVTNVGSCPTVKVRAIHAETMISDFSGDLYGKKIYVYLLGYIRKEKRFDSLEELREQIYKDKKIAETENGDLKWLEIGLSSQ